jgi:hypothetical protein
MMETVVALVTFLVSLIESTSHIFMMMIIANVGLIPQNIMFPLVATQEPASHLVTIFPHRPFSRLAGHPAHTS